MIQSVVLGWLARRIPDWGGWLTMAGSAALWLFDAYSRMTPTDQEVIGQLLQGNWKTVTLGGAAGFISLIISQWRSYRATVTPQVVTEEGIKVETKKLPRTKNRVEELVEDVLVTAPPKKKPSIGGLFDWFRQ
jgi:hypothetical protein